MRLARLSALVACSALALGACSDAHDGGVDQPLHHSLMQALAQNPARPSIVNHRLPSPIHQSSHALTWDGRLVVGAVSLTTTSEWKASMFRPEAITYDASGAPNLFDGAFSTGVVVELLEGENALSFCFEGSTRPELIRGQAHYRPFIIDSRMFGGVARFRRRTAHVRVIEPFTTFAEVTSFTLGTPQFLATTSGGDLQGVEPALTADGRLMVFQGGPDNGPDHDHLMYTYNPTPCALTGWTPPKPLSAIHFDALSNPGLRRYPLSWMPLRAANGEAFAPAAPGRLIRAAYPWVDDEGRNVLYAAVIHKDGARREAMSLIGVDTHHTAYHIDGAINTDRQDIPHLFYSSPMWNFERERNPYLTFPPGSSNLSKFLPVTKTHDVLPLLGGNTSDYHEIDLGDLVDPFYLVYLPLNEFVTASGDYDLRRTPDISGRHYIGVLTGNAQIDPLLVTTQATMPPTEASEAEEDLATPPPSPFWSPHGKGHALALDGNGGVAVTLAPSGPSPGIGSTIRGFTVEVAVKPATSIHQGCPEESGPRHLLAYPGVLSLRYHRDDRVEMILTLNGGSAVSLGKSAALRRGHWTQLAYTWDGTSGKFTEYQNGIASWRALPNAPGAVTLPSGTLHVGSTGVPDPSPCPGPLGRGFIGHIDEVRLFTHARSGRSICLGARGTACRESGIQQNPSGGHFALAHQNPGCNSAAAVGALACQSAFHRACAQRGAVDALASTTNVAQTIAQLLSDRPPVSMLGVPTWAADTFTTVACSPILHESLAASYSELERHDPGCTDERTAASPACMQASHRFCNSVDWSTGHLFESTSRAWVGCFESDHVANVPVARLGPVSATLDFAATQSRLEVSAWCMFYGYEGGVFQELLPGGAAEVHCFRSPAVVQWNFHPG